MTSFYARSALVIVFFILLLGAAFSQEKRQEIAALERFYSGGANLHEVKKPVPVKQLKKKRKKRR